MTVLYAVGEVVQKDEGTFLVKPGLGLMVWTLLAFGITMLILRKFAFPKIQDALDRRQRLIEESIEAADRTREEAEQLLSDYRARLAEARVQAEEIVERAQKNSELYDAEAREATDKVISERKEQAARDIEAEARRAISDIRREVADLTIAATEKVTRKTLNTDDQRKLVEDALAELDFTSLTGERGQ
jgi:F-type H+-transporting ATPase subunit b